jgi:hypothetical protein
MFLFTTPPARETAPANPVVDAIRQGAERTGTGFEYLLATAQKESALNPAARAGTSSAAGLFQFIEQTWLGLVKSEGPKLGLGNYAGAIATRPDGAHVVEDPTTRQAILSLREDPKVSSVMAGAFTQRNRDLLAAELGREPSPSDLYVAHFLGPRGATQLIQAAQQSPTRPIAADFPDAAAANRNVFYDRKGRARGAGEVYALLAAQHGTLNGPAASAAPAFGPDKPVAFARQDGPAFHGLFQTDTRRGPISDAVARLWQGREGERSEPLSFFPRSNSQEDVSAATEISAPAETPMLSSNVPLPPPRPSDIDAIKVGTAAGSNHRAGPLDLTTFMKRPRT